MKKSEIIHTTGSLRLPDRSTTKDYKKFMREWEKISNPIQRAFKLRLSAFDPDVVFVDAEYKTRVELPVEFAQKLCKIIAERNSLRRKVKELERKKVRKYHERG